MTNEFKIKPELFKFIKRCEAKRVGENLTKVELTDLIGVHYNFYCNCVAQKNNPSPNMMDAIKEYLDTPTIEVYETIFARRVTSTKSNNKIARDENGKEVFHERLDMKKEEYEEIIDGLEKNGKFREPVDRMK
ncbi:hypothetical protein [Peribacillus asahii]|uniref:hypothetical protein n=1 Tax=Peribacillus asahii TaxID=228899 RepID=UPI003830BAD4